MIAQAGENTIIDAKDLGVESQGLVTIGCDWAGEARGHVVLRPANPGLQIVVPSGQVVVSHDSSETQAPKAVLVPDTSSGNGLPTDVPEALDTDAVKVNPGMLKESTLLFSEVPACCSIQEIQALLSSMYIYEQKVCMENRGLNYFCYPTG